MLNVSDDRVVVVIVHVLDDALFGSIVCVHLLCHAAFVSSP